MTPTPSFLSVAIARAFGLCCDLGVIVGVGSSELTPTPSGSVLRRIYIRTSDWHLLHNRHRSNGVGERCGKVIFRVLSRGLLELRPPPA